MGSNQDAAFDLRAEDLYGGKATASTCGGSAGDGSADATRTAATLANLEAFNQHIAMGANVQYNSMDLSVVGGGDTATLYGDES